MHPQKHSAKGIFQIEPPVSCVNFLNNKPIFKVGANMRGNEHEKTLETF